MIITIPSILIMLFSPFLGYIFVTVLGGSCLLKDKCNSTLYFVLLLIGLIALTAIGLMDGLQLSDRLIGVVLPAYLVINAVKSKKFNIAFYAGFMIQGVWAIVRSILFRSVHLKQVSEFSEIFREQMLTKWSISNQEVIVEFFEQLMKFMIDYQIAIWAVTMIIAHYLTYVLLARKYETEWKHSLLRFSGIIVYVLIPVLLLAVIPATRLWGMNLLLILASLFMIQGLAIIDFMSKKMTNNNRFILIATVMMIIINPLFVGLLVALWGMLDYWLDIRKVTQY